MHMLHELLTSNTEALTARIRQQAEAMGADEVDVCANKAWQDSVNMLTATMVQTLENHGLKGLKLSLDGTDPASPMAEFAMETARRHQERGISLAMFLGMLKLYRNVYLDFLAEHIEDRDLLEKYQQFIRGFFDHTEIIQSTDWAKARNEKKVAELSAKHQAMTREKDRFLTLFNSLATPVFLLDDRDNIELMNIAATNFLGGDDMPEELNYARPKNLPAQHADSKVALLDAVPWLAKELRRACPMGKPHHNCRFDAKGLVAGVHRHYNVSVSNLDGESSHFSGITVVIDDITMRVKVERQLAHERNMAADYLDVVGSIVVAMDASGGIMLLNKTGYQVLGFDEGELLGRNWIEAVVPPEEQDELKDYFYHILSDNIESDDNYTNYVTTKSGEPRLIQWRNRLLRNEAGLPIGILASGLDITNQREMEDALAEKEVWLRNTFVALGEGVLILSPDDMIIDANPAAEAIFQMTNQEICDSPIEALHVDRNHYVEFDERVRRAFEKGETAAFEFSMRRKDGIVFPTEHSVSLITDDSGTVLGKVSALRDISARKMRETHLKESEEKFRRIFETIEEGFIVTSMDGIIQMVNPATCSLLGYEETELLGKDMGMLYFNENERNKLIFRLRNKGFVHGIHLTAKRSDGSTIVVEANAHVVRDQRGEPVAMEGTFRDITSRLEADKMVREREKQYRAFFENNHAIMLLEDPKTGDIMDANPAASEFYGYSVDEMRTMSTAQINALSEEEIFQEMFKARSENRSYFIFKHRLADGELRDVEVYSGPIMVWNNQLLYSVIHDVTERIQLEREMKRLATTDALTGSNNRHQLFNLAGQELKRTQRYGHSLAVLMLDIDYFKNINDTYGHQTGDVVLKALSAMSEASLRETDIFGRLGGEEFAAVLPETDMDAALQVAERLRSDLSHLKVRDRETQINFTVSIGVAAFSKRDKIFDDILNRADEALYKAKRRGRNRVETG